MQLTSNKSKSSQNSGRRETSEERKERSRRYKGQTSEPSLTKETEEGDRSTGSAVSPTGSMMSSFSHLSRAGSPANERSTRPRRTSQPFQGSRPSSRGSSVVIGASLYTKSSEVFESFTDIQPKYRAEQERRGDPQSPIWAAKQKNSRTRQLLNKLKPSSLVDRKEEEHPQTLLEDEAELA